MTMETMTRCLEFFESRLTKLFIAPPKGFGRHALALLAVMACAVGEVSAQSTRAIASDLKSDGTSKVESVMIDIDGTEYDAGSKLVEQVNSLNLTFDASKKTYARLYAAKNKNGDILETPDVVKFSGISLSNWSDYGADGYVYYGNGFDVNTLLGDIKVSTNSGVSVVLVISKDDPSGVKYDLLSGKSWRLAYEVTGHFANQDWAGYPDAKKDGNGLYDDRISFKGGWYYYNPGYDGKTLVNGGFTLKGGTGERDITLDNPTTPKQYEIVTHDGADWIRLPNGGPFPYLYTNNQYTGPTEYKILDMTDDYLMLSYTDNNYTWSFIFTPDIDPTTYFSDKSRNIIKDVTPTFNTDGGWTSTAIDGGYRFHFDNLGGGQWDSQIRYFLNNLPKFTAGVNLDYYVKFKASRSYLGPTSKIEGGLGFGGYRFPVEADKEYTIYRVNVPNGDEPEKFEWLFSCGGTPAGPIDIEITDMLIQPHVNNDPTNLWNSATKNPTFWTKTGAGENEYNNNVDQSYKVLPNGYYFEIPAYNGTDWWAHQFIFPGTDVKLEAGKKYDFSCILRSNRENKKVKVKLKKNDEAGNDYLYEGDVSIPNANQEVLFQLSNLDVANGTNVTDGIDNLKLVFGFGETGTGTGITISNIIIKEHVATETVDNIVKEPEYDAKIVLAGFLSSASSTSWHKTHTLMATNEISVSVDLNTGAQLSAAQKGLEVKYLRWDLKDANGNSLLNQGYEVTVDGLTFEDNTAVKEKFGVYWHSATATALGNLRVTITAPTGKSLEGCRLYGYVGTNEGVLSDGKVIQEPLYDALLEFPIVLESFVSRNSTINTGKVPVVKYKTVLYDKDTRTLTPSLFANWREVVADVVSTHSEFPSKGYLRWYVEDDANNLVVADDFSASRNYIDMGQFGHYYQFESVTDAAGLPLAGPDNTDYDPAIRIPAILPSGTDITGEDNTNYKKVRLVCVVTTDRSNGDLPSKEYENILAKYIFVPYTLKDYQDQPFVHSTGVSKRPFESVSNKIPGASDSGEKTQYVWNYDTASYAESTEGNDIRQSVHTVIYDYYVETDKEINLRLPFAIDYTKNTEPLGYFRWYNYLTDLKAGSELTIKGSSLVETDRGFIALRPVENSQNADDDNIGVLFKPTSATTYPLYIACDVSRYFDGIEYTTGKYMLHEPTLSMRYIFRINKAQTIADNIETQFNSNWEINSSSNVRPKSASLDADAAKVFSNLEEDNGLVVVSLNGTKGEFALRMDKAKAANVGNNGEDLVNVFGNYFLQNTATQAKKLRWDVYYKDDTEGWMVKPIDMTKETFIGFGNWEEDYHNTNFVPKFQKRSGWRIGTYTLDDFVNATGFEYQKLDGTTTSASYNALTLNTAAQTTFHVVGVLSGDDDVERPVAHYELKFLDAKPLLYSELESNTSRKDDVLREKLPLGTTLTFDDYFSTDTQIKYKKPENSVENYASMPLAWDNAQYGFCYPELYAFNGTSYRITRKDWWQGFGFSPLHGDYTLLKSMYLPKVSVPGETEENVFYTNYFRDNKLPNYTTTGKYANVPKDQIDTPFYDITNHKTNGADFGTFLYVDAADEPRTIAKLSFDAAGLCENSELYYTAYLADLTSPRQTAPQVMFHVYTFKDNDKTKERSLVMSFLASDLSTLISDYSTMQLADKDNASTASPKEYDVIQKDLGHWYQIYGHVTIPKGKLPEVDAGTAVHFEVEIDNYATSTCGADYGIDEISFYTSAANLYVEQNSNTVCDANGKLEARFYLGAENLQNVLTKSSTKRTIYYRIVNAETNQPATGIKYSTTTIDDSGVYSTVDNDLAYGQVEIITDYTDAQVVENSARNINNPVGFYKDADGNVEFCLAWRNDYPFDGNTKYYMSLLDLNYTPSSSEANDHWGCPENSCSIYSASFIARKVHLDLLDGDTPISEKTASCDGWWRASVTAAASLPKGDGYVTGDNGFNIIKNMHYDYYVGTIDEFNSTTNLMQALDDYRDQSGFDKAGLDPAYKAINEAYYRALETEVADGRLLLNFSAKFEYEFVDEGLYNFVAIPYERYVDLSGTTPVTYRTQKSDEAAAICQPIPFSLNYKSSQPRLELGFDDVDYPNTDTYRTIRIGADQISKLQSDYILHVPVRDYADKSKNAKTGTLTLQSFKLFGTNDPTIAKADVSNDDGSTTKDDYVVASSATLATFEETKVGNDKMYISLNFHGTDVTKLNFREGYEYKIILQYHDSNDDSDDNRCESSLPLLFKIVPEYVTWEGSTVNINWQNDENWSRSKKADLYKTANQYTDNGDAGTDLEGLGTDQPKSYVPMKFTYVTMPTANRAPQLLDLKMSTDPYNQVISNVSEGIDAASTNIQYDIMVRYSLDGSDGQDKCLGHKTHNGTAWVDSNVGKDAAKTFDCEKFYGNICREIYFKPEAELLNQHYLTYNKAWVERNLKAAKWQLVSTPLKGTYSGDMYVPTSGQQTTEAFKDITLGDGYSRTQYPIYQRSWSGKEAKVVTETADARRPNYDANMNIAVVDKAFTQWSHTYNDVDVDYNGLGAFAIRASRDGSTLGDAMIRLPKADTRYTYVNYQNGSDNNSPQGIDLQTIRSANGNGYASTYGKFVTGADGSVSSQLTAIQERGGYYLVGNPYMASLNMADFFEKNKATFDTNYWTYDFETGNPEVGTTLTDQTAGIIKPLQAFFVKLKDGVTADQAEVTFSADMTIDGNMNPAGTTATRLDQSGNNGQNGSDTGNGQGANGARRAAISLTASNAAAASTARVVIDAEASADYVENEDVETLFDMNLSSVPMVYTVAGRQAVSIDVRPATDVIAFGVVCTESNEPVEVVVDGLGVVADGAWFVADAATGETTAVAEGQTLTVQPNDYGRYFLTTRGDMTAISQTAADATDGIIVSVRGRELTVRSQQALSAVRLLTVGGEAVATAADCGTELSLQLNAGGVYIVDAQTTTAKKAVKVVVK